MNGFDIVHEEKIDANVHFFRINPTDIRVTLKWIFKSLSPKSWISKFDEEYIRNSFEVRSNATIEYLQQNILTGKEDSITSQSGEYVVSELALGKRRARRGPVGTDQRVARSHPDPAGGTPKIGAIMKKGKIFPSKQPSRPR